MFVYILAAVERADAACAPGLLLYGLLRKCCCASLSSHPQPITLLGPQWSAVKAYTQTHMYAYCTSTGAHMRSWGVGGGMGGCNVEKRRKIPSSMRDKRNRWKECASEVILSIKVKRTVWTDNQREGFRAHCLKNTDRHETLLLRPAERNMYGCFILIKFKKKLQHSSLW